MKEVTNMITVKRLVISRTLYHLTIEKPILLPYSKKELIELFFDKGEDEEGNTFYRINYHMLKISDKIDYINIPFDDVKLSGYILDDMHNIRINPQRIYKKDLSNTTLGKNVIIIGNEDINQKDLFDGVNINSTKFKGCQNVRINPQTILNKDLSHTQLEGVDFTGYSFDGSNLWKTDFTGSIGAKINPNKVFNFEQTKDISDVELLDLPEAQSYGVASNAKNFAFIESEEHRIKSEFLNLIKEQLPEQEKETEPELASQPIEPPKQKRKFFGKN